MAKALESVKTAVTATGAAATAAAKGIGAAFTAVLGPLGIATKAFEILAPLIDTQSEALTELKGYWDQIKTTVSDALNGMITETVTYLKSLVEMVTSNETVVAAFNMLKEYGTAALENIVIATENTVEMFKTFGMAAIETGKGVIIILGQVYESIQKTFGIDGTKALTGWGEAIQTWVLDKVELVGIAIRHVPDFYEIAYLKIKETIINIGEYMMTIPANAAIIGTYIANNWTKLLADGFNAVGTAFYNLGKNIKNIWQAVLDFIKTGKFDVNLTPLLEGFKATADKVPELIKPNLTKTADAAIQAIYDRIAADELKRKGKKPEPGTPEAAAAAAVSAAAAAPGGGFKTESFGVADLASKMRAGILNKESDDKIAKQLLAAERTAKAVEKMNEKMDKPKPAVVA